MMRSINALRGNNDNNFLILTGNNIILYRIIFYITSIAILIKFGLQIEYEDTRLITNLFPSLLYFFMGIVAATIANSTGAGGGIVFLPIFIGLGFSPMESLSTSIAIQCFGMSSGALTWLSYRQKQLKEGLKKWNNFYHILSIGALFSCIGLLLSQYWAPASPINIELFFAIFSLVIGSVILFRTLKKKQYIEREHKLSNIETLGLAIVGLLGGAITSWISVGIGELLLIYLIFLRFRLDLSVAIAVCVSAISVLLALPFHMFSLSISFEVLVFAAPGAIVGGVIARSLATYLGAYKLKIAASSWIVLSSMPFLMTLN